MSPVSKFVLVPAGPIRPAYCLAIFDPSGNKSARDYRGMNEWLRIGTGFCIGLVLGYLGGFFSHRFALRRDLDGRRRSFRAAIKKQIQNFETFDTAQQNWGKLIEAHQATVKPISDACIDVAEDIRPEMRPKFKQSFLAYCGLKGQEIEPYDGATAEYLEKHAVISVLPNYAKGVSIITGHLHALIECAR